MPLACLQMTTLKQRHQVYLPDDLSSALDTLGGQRGCSKSAVVAAALRHWIDRRAANALDDRFALTLARFARDQGRVEDKLAYLSEAFATFVQHQLTLVAHLPPFTPEAARLGQQRYGLFVEAVGRRLARADRAPSGQDALIACHPETVEEEN